MEATIAEKDYDGIWREMTAKFWQRKPLCTDLETQIQQRLGRIKATVLYQTDNSQPLAIEVSSHDGLMRGAAIVADGDHFEWQTGFRKAAKRLLRIMMVAGVEGVDFHWRPRLYHDLLATDRNVLEYLRQRFPALEGVHIDTVLARERARREEKRKQQAANCRIEVAAIVPPAVPGKKYAPSHLMCDKCGDLTLLHSCRGEKPPDDITFPCRIKGCSGTRRLLVLPLPAIVSYTTEHPGSGTLEFHKDIVKAPDVVATEAQHGTAEQS